MTEQNFTEVIGALDDLLEAEREALLKGDLEKIGRLLEQKESLIAELSALEAGEAASLQRLGGKIRRNQDLLDHALEGIRAVAGRLAELRRVKRSLDTYDANGNKQTVDLNTDVSVEKRA